jgi:hypothetical protein
MEEVQEVNYFEEFAGLLDGFLVMKHLEGNIDVEIYGRYKNVKFFHVDSKTPKVNGTFYNNNPDFVIEISRRSNAIDLHVFSKDFEDFKVIELMENAIDKVENITKHDKSKEYVPYIYRNLASKSVHCRIDFENGRRAIDFIKTFNDKFFQFGG